MSEKKIINIGTAELAGDGETLRSAFDKINHNFDDLYAANLSLDAQFLEGNPGAFYLDYVNFENTPQIPLDVSDLTDSTNLLAGGGIALTDISVTTNPAGTAALTYDNTTGVFTYTPPDLSGLGGGASYTDSDVDTHLNTGTATANQILAYDGADYAWIAQPGGGAGIALSDLSVTTASAGTAALAYNSTTGVFTYTPPDLSSFSTFDGDYNSLTNKPTIPTAYTDSDVDTHLNQSNPTSGYVLSWNGSDYAWVAQSAGGGGIALSDLSVGAEDPASGDGGISYDNTTGVFTYAPPDLSGYQPTSNVTADIDGHLNTSTATSGQILSWNGTDYAWVADQTGSGGGIALSDLSVTTASAGTAALAYNNTTGVFTYTPPDLSSFSTFDGDYDSLTNKPTIPTALTNIQDETYGVSVTGKMAVTTIDIGSGGINASPGGTYDLQGTTINFGSATIMGGSAFNSTINNHLWSGATAPTDGYVLSWDASALSGSGDYSWVAQGGIALSDLSVTTASASGTPSLAYNNTTGVFTYTPPDLANAIVANAQYSATVTTNAADTSDTGAYILGNTGSASATGSSTGWVFADIVQDPDNPGTSTILDVDNALLTGDVVGDITSSGTSQFNGTVDFSNSSSVDFTGATVSGISTGAITASNIESSAVSADSTDGNNFTVTGGDASGLNSTGGDAVITGGSGALASGDVNIGTTQTTAIAIGASSVGTTVGGTLTTNGNAIFETGTFEAFHTINAATGTVTHDCDNGHIFYHTSPAADWTANFTNLGLNANYGTGITLIIAQGATAYIPTAVQTDGVSRTILWQGGSAPTGNANGTDAVSFSILRTSGSYIVLGQLVDFS